MTIQKRLFELQDKEYALFLHKLTPNVPLESFIGVRVPVLRKLAKALVAENDYSLFLEQLPHKYLDEKNIWQNELKKEQRTSLAKLFNLDVNV